MAQVMAVLLRAAEAWSAMTATESSAKADERKLEVLGSLVQLLSRRFHGFREVPTARELQLTVKEHSITLRVRSPGRVPLGSEVIERQLAKLGFVTERVPGTESRELVVAWTREPCATVIALPRVRAALGRRRRLR